MENNCMHCSNSAHYKYFNERCSKPCTDSLRCIGFIYEIGRESWSGKASCQSERDNINKLIHISNLDPKNSLNQKCSMEMQSSLQIELNFVKISRSPKLHERLFSSSPIKLFPWLFSCNRKPLKKLRIAEMLKILFKLQTKLVHPNWIANSFDPTAKASHLTKGTTTKKLSKLEDLQAHSRAVCMQRYV